MLQKKQKVNKKKKDKKSKKQKNPKQERNEGSLGFLNEEISQARGVLQAENPEKLKERPTGGHQITWCVWTD